MTIYNAMRIALKSGRALPTVEGQSESVNTFRISDDAVAKISESAVINGPLICHEATAMNIVRARTNIPVPRVMKVLNYEDRQLTIVMEYVEGQQLHHAWPKLSLLSKLRVAWTLRSYIRQLRKIHSTQPGPPANEPLNCCGFIFDHSWRGPFKDEAALTAYFRGRRAVPHLNDPFIVGRPLVLTHFDLNMHNILLDTSGKLWLIDWAWSGFFPDWFEYVSTLGATMPKTPLEAPVSFRRCIPFITDAFYLEAQWLCSRHGFRAA